MVWTHLVVWIWALPHRWFEYGLYPISGLFEGIYPDSVWLISSNVIPKEDCRVFVLWCQSALHHTCPVLSVSPIIYSHTSHTGFMHIFIHSCIHIYMHINIHAHIACIQLSFIHNCIDHLVSYFNCISQKCHPQMCLVQMCHQSSVFQTACSSSNSLKIPFYLVASVFQTACSSSNSLKVPCYIVFSVFQTACSCYLVFSVFQTACSSSNSLEVPFYHCFLSNSNGMFFVEQFESTNLPYFLSISNGMFIIEQFESTILPLFPQ